MRSAAPTTTSPRKHPMTLARNHQQISTTTTRERPPSSALEIHCATPRVRLDRVTDGPTPEELEQLARSVAMAGVLGDRDLLDVVAALRRLADIEKAVRRHPAAGDRPGPRPSPTSPNPSSD